MKKHVSHKHTTERLGHLSSHRMHLLRYCDIDLTYLRVNGQYVECEVRTGKSKGMLFRIPANARVVLREEVVRTKENSTVVEDKVTFYEVLDMA